MLATRVWKSENSGNWGAEVNMLNGWQFLGFFETKQSAQQAANTVANFV